MKQHEIARLISRKTNITQRSVNEVLSALAEVFCDVFQTGEDIKLGIGTFDMKLRPPKPAYNFKQKKKITLPPATIVNYKPSIKIYRVLRTKDLEDKPVQVVIE